MPENDLPKMTYEQGLAQIPDRELPGFWFGDVRGLTARWEALQRGQARLIAISPGGRPIHVVTFGAYENVRGAANFNSAIGGRDASAYMNKAERDRPVVLFLGPVHGQEVENLTGLVNLIEVMESGRDLRGKDQPELRALGDRCRMVIIPQANPDGIARFAPRCSAGELSEGRFPWGMGTLSDGGQLVWPYSKLQHPMVGDNVGFPGCYFNDAGVNPMHDDFLDPMGPEAPAVLKVAKEEGPDLAVSLHSHSYPPAVLRPAYVTIEVQQEAAELARRLYALLRERGLPGGNPDADPFQASADGGEYPAPFNLTSAIYHISGASSFTFECPHGFADDKFCTVTIEQILDIQLTLYEAMLRHALENKGGDG